MANMNPVPKFQPGNKAGLRTRFQKGQSGNPLGRSRLRHEFDVILADALMGPKPAASAQLLAKLVWKAAKKSEAWAITLLFQRLSPQALKVKVGKDEDENPIDYSRLSEQEFAELGRLLAKATNAPDQKLLDGRAISPEPENIC